jgi:hypothetical protein
MKIKSTIVTGKVSDQEALEIAKGLIREQAKEAPWQPHPEFIKDIKFCVRSCIKDGYSYRKTVYALLLGTIKSIPNTGIIEAYHRAKAAIAIIKEVYVSE